MNIEARLLSFGGNAESKSAGRFDLLLEGLCLINYK